MKRFIAALALLALSGWLCYWLKLYVDSENPQYGVPQIQVVADMREVPCKLVGYEWVFFSDNPVFGTREASHSLDPSYEMSDIFLSTDREELVLKGGEIFDITFSKRDYISLEIYQMDWDTANFVETDDMMVPFEKKVYIYDVIAVFDNGWVEYYFKIIVE